MSEKRVKEKFDANAVKLALARRHGSESGTGQWVCIEEAFSGFASAGGGVDLLAIGVWRTAKAPGLPGAGRDDACNPVVAYEVKVSRADYRREVNGYQPGPDASWRTRAVLPWPAKAYFALERSHYFMFAVPKGLLTDEEIEQRERPENGLWLPPEAGLVEVDGRGCTVREPAPRRHLAHPLTRHETAELLRHGLDPNKGRQTQAENARLRGEIERLRRRLDDVELAA